jgi:TRAP-type C4-dicarboxylate transport system substrate-binding protein
MRYSKLVLAAAALTTACVSLVVPVVAEAQTVLRFNRWLPPTHNVQGGVMGAWAKEVERVSEGRVRVEFTASSLGPPPRQFDLAAQGVADLVLGVHGYTPSRFRMTQVAEMPFLGESGETISGAYWEVHQQHLAKAGEHAGVKVLALWVHGPGMIANSKRPIDKLADIDGLKLRVAGGLMTDMAARLGAVPVTAPVPQLYEILSRGVADGVLFTNEGITGFNLEKIVRHITTVPGGLFNTSFFLAVNPAKWNSLSAADRAAIEAISGKQLSMAAGRSYDERDRQATPDLVAAGIEIRAADAELVAELGERLAPLEKEWIADADAKGVAGTAALEMLRKLSSR